MVLLTPLLERGHWVPTLPLYVLGSIYQFRLYDKTCFLLGSFFLISACWSCSKFTSLSPGFYVCRPRHYNLICWELNLKSGSFAFFWLIKWMDGIHKCDWCHAGWMLTQELTPDPTCKLNISSFLALPHLLDSLICTRNSTSIVLLL